MKNCPITGVNIKRFSLSLICGFVFIFAFDFLVHGNLLMDMYEDTAHLWRGEDEMRTYFPFMLLSQFLLAFITAMIFTRHFEEKGIKEGVRYGVLIGIFMAIMMSSSYAWMPIPGALAIAWGVSGFLLGIGLGVIYALTYKK